ncbi:cyanobactin maturation protease PatG family protein [Hyalangium versicolor]|uniref:cyanobactin maturation protease PatG family protein n=1 Tax=Hyalangium versicolor TaxID=2861190 RepID=UPI001CCA450F|nr:hypothetical protein [Hyalangium versicolor]
MLTPSSSIHPQAEVRTTRADASSAIFALGRLGYDFDSEARRDFFLQRLGGPETQAFAPLDLAEYLREHPEDAQGLTWTLTLDGTPIYALAPEESSATASVQQLIHLLVEQEKEGVERICVAGCFAGSTCLMTGNAVPQLIPVMRGTGCWNIARFTQRCLGELPPEEASDERERYEERQAYLQRFVEQLAQKAWNLGVSARDRALNFAVTHAFQAGEVFEGAFQERLVMDSIVVEGSTRAPPGCECWDVKLRFQDPASRNENARKVYRYTVDVSDALPGIVGGLDTRVEF